MNMNMSPVDTQPYTIQQLLETLQKLFERVSFIAGLEVVSIHHERKYFTKDYYIYNTRV